MARQAPRDLPGVARAQGVGVMADTDRLERLQLLELRVLVEEQRRLTAEAALLEYRLGVLRESLRALSAAYGLCTEDSLDLVSGEIRRAKKLDQTG